tara:strand:+ start:355 stop:648 length:294 start_codon:yes stop_codon:yes gene_type:complete
MSEETKYKNPLSFFKKLKKLIEEDKPDNCNVVYDMKNCEVYVIKKGFEFNDKSLGTSGTSWHGVLTPVSEPSYDEGHSREAIVGGGIYVPMEAVQGE